MPLVLGGSAVTAVTQKNSCRFNDGDSPDLSLSQAAGTSTKKLTVSIWFKRGALYNYGTLWSTGTGTADGMQVAFYQDELVTESWDGSVNPKIQTTRVFRDPSAWYHLCMIWDTTESVAGDRIRLYINGAELTDFSQDTNPSLNYDIPGWSGSGDTVSIGKEVLAGSWSYFDGYLAEVCCLDGQALGPTSFGEFDSDSPTIWKPKTISGLTFGAQGFYLDFADSANLGNDVSGNGNDFTVANLAAADQATDSPDNNFCVNNSLDNYYFDATFSEGNCYLVLSSSTNETYGTTTLGLSAGKWYWEVKYVTDTGSDNPYLGITNAPSLAKDDYYLGRATGEYAYAGGDGNTYTAGSGTAYGNTYTIGDVIGHYLDLDNNKMYWAINGTVQNSGTGLAITAITSTTHGFYWPAVSYRESGQSATFACNYGGCPSFAITSGNTDTNGYGNFEYDPSAGTFDSASKDFLAICTKNLSTDGG